MRKKLAVLFLGAALTVSMLGACGGKDAASSSASAVSASSAADASSASVQDASKAESSTSTSDVSAESASAAETAGESNASELEDGTYTADFNIRCGFIKDIHRTVAPKQRPRNHKTLALAAGEVSRFFEKLCLQSVLYL